jgi:excinuclease ABC subunit B
MDFILTSEFLPTGDQPEAIKQLVEGVNSATPYQTLLGVTGSGKTFTIANVIQQIKRPTLVLSHNKTLAAQLYSEFKAFFPDNAVEFFISYYDYYQPEAYLPISDTYIEKDLAINDEIEKLRLSATSSLLSGRRDVIIVASVSCIYGIGNPDDFHKNTITIQKGQTLSRNKFLRMLVDSLYSRNEVEFNHGNFRVRGDTIDIHIAYGDVAYRVVFWGDEIESLEVIDPVSGYSKDKPEALTIYPATIFVTTKERIKTAIHQIQDDMVLQTAYFHEIGKHLEAKRLEERTTFDLEMIRELGHCSGIENYSRYFDGRAPGTRPFCLLDYFPKDFLMVVDESHVTIPQIRAMYGGDRSRKQNLVEYGFRLPAAMDNRPLKFDEWEALTMQTIFMSATPAPYELEKSEGIVVEQVIRPTGLPDPVIEVRPSGNQIDNLLGEIRIRVKLNERVLVTTLTKRMAEELTKYLSKININCRYIHSDVETLERVEIIAGLRSGQFDVLIGVNLLREGLDLPEVSLVAILDADKEGFLRSEVSLTQTAGRAARNLNGLVIMYADKITNSMKRAMDETTRRRVKQLKYNEINNITPQQIIKAQREGIAELKGKPGKKAYFEREITDIAADPVIRYMDKSGLEALLSQTKAMMKKAAADLDFIEAARLRDEMYAIERKIKGA